MLSWYLYLFYFRPFELLAVILSSSSRTLLPMCGLECDALRCPVMLVLRACGFVLILPLNDLSCFRTLLPWYCLECWIGSEISPNDVILRARGFCLSQVWTWLCLRDFWFDSMVWSFYSIFSLHMLYVLSIFSSSSTVLYWLVGLCIEAELCDFVRMMQVLIRLGLTQFWLGFCFSMLCCWT